MSADGRIAGVLVGVTYRNLRNWDGDQFLRDYVEQEFDDDDEMLAILASPRTTQNGSGESGGDDGLAILEGLGVVPEAPETPVDPSRLLAVVAQHYGATGDSSVADGLTRAQLYVQIQERLTQAAEYSAQDKRDERRQSTPIRLVREARQKVVRARDALSRSKLGSDFEHGKLDYELRQLRKEVTALTEANEGDA